MPKLKISHCTVELLDGSDFIVDSNNLHNVDELLTYVCKKIGTNESDYFGLRYVHLKDGKISWLNRNQPLSKQLKKASGKFKVGIQFFPDTFNSLQDEITRYQFVLQTRENLLTGLWCCSMPTQALLASYIVQAEFEDYDSATHADGYLDGLQFASCQSSDFLEKVALFHQNHKGLSPSDADWLYMKTARKTLLYGMDVHNVEDADGNIMILAINVYGMHILHMNTILHSFLWAVVSKVQCHGKDLYLSLKIAKPKKLEGGHSEYVSVVFITPSDTDAKRIMKSCTVYQEFSNCGTVKKSKKNEKSPTCSHISTRLLAKDFQRVSSLEFTNKVQNGIDGYANTREEREEHIMYSSDNDTSKDSTHLHDSSGIDSSITCELDISQNSYNNIDASHEHQISRGGAISTSGGNESANLNMHVNGVAVNGVDAMKPDEVDADKNVMSIAMNGVCGEVDGLDNNCADSSLHSREQQGEVDVACDNDSLHPANETEVNGTNNNSNGIKTCGVIFEENVCTTDVDDEVISSMEHVNIVNTDAYEINDDSEVDFDDHEHEVFVIEDSGIPGLVFFSDISSSITERNEFFGNDEFEELSNEEIENSFKVAT